MSMVLTAKNKIGFVDGTITTGNPTDSNKPGHAVNTMILSWILNSVSKEIAASIIFVDSAAAMWRSKG